MNTYLWGADVIGRIAGILAGVPVIISTVQNVDVWKKWHHIIIDKILACRTDMFIAVSEAVRDYCNKRIGISLKRIIVIPNAIEVEKFQNNGHNEYLYNELNINENDFILSCIARLTEQKGQRYLLQSISRLRYKFPNLRVLFAGEGEDKEILEKMAQELGIIDNVRFLGQRQDISEILYLSDGVVLPSLYEGLPVCLVEAMAVGKPVIATAVGGTPEIVYDKETGFLIPPADVYALEKAIEKNRKQKRALMCLKIELRPIKSLIDSLLRAQSKIGKNIPPTDILELDIATQAPQFMFFKEKVAEKIYGLSTCLRSVNEHRKVASDLLSNQSDPKFQTSANIFVIELKKAQQLLNEINRLIDLEQPDSRDAKEPQ